MLSSILVIVLDCTLQRFSVHSHEIEKGGNDSIICENKIVSTLKVTVQSELCDKMQGNLVNIMI